MTIKAVIFDMGGVLIESPSGMWIGMETDLKIDKGSLFAAMLDPVLKTDVEALERGEITADEFDLIFTQFYNKQVN
ncbi:unnamed protein product [Cylicostephanus goldi]|uniref:Uncharacterized protein n=1 Tax=Cylicostephanus goldi TaxID=71465 RepID=A0A3P6TMR9_CYLGO|nr:unnamed protein product [Cylicostephanus goldi]